MTEGLARDSVLHLRWGAWHGDEVRSFAVPESWQVFAVPEPRLPALSAERVREKLDSPVYGRALRELVRPDATVAIVVDDHTRPLHVGGVVEWILDTTAAVGVPMERVTVIVATGLHGTPTEEDLRSKLGAPVLRRARVVSHSPDQATSTVVGPRGVRVGVNRLFTEATCRVTVSTTMPHLYAGYSGGAKLIMPGLAGTDGVSYTHRAAMMGLAGGVRQVESNRFRTFLEGVATAVGVHFAIQLLPTAGREIGGVFAGDLVAGHRASVAAGEEAYASAFPADLDAVLLNAYPKDTELLQSDNAFIPFRTAPRLVKPEGVVVLASASPQGLGAHGLFGVGGVLVRVPKAEGFLQGRHLIGFVPGVKQSEFQHRYWSGYSHHVTWDGVVAELEQRLGQGIHLGVLPTAPLQVAAASD